MVAAGYEHTMAIRNDGTLWGWGQNNDDQLGNGCCLADGVPSQIGTSTWKAVAAGSDFTVAIRNDGTLWGWGYGFYGADGTGLLGSADPPTKVGTATSWVSVAAGGQMGAGIRSDGTLWTWGNDLDGQLGIGSNHDQRSSPVQVGTATNWKSVSVGVSSMLGIRTDGTLWAWGDNTYGEVGDGTTTERDTPVQIGAATNWTSVAAGQKNSLAVRGDGSLWTWGDNQYGEIGDGTTGGSRLWPEQIGYTGDWQSVATGWMTAGVAGGALRRDGTLWLWGSGVDGELGDGTTANTDSPQEVGNSTTGSPSPWAGVTCWRRAATRHCGVGVRTSSAGWATAPRAIRPPTSY